MFAFVASVQISGAAHVAGDVVELITLGHHVDDADAGEDDPNHECPPGCPTCHHVHVGSLALPVYVAPSSFVQFVEQAILVILYDDDAPKGPDPNGVYRPPRVAVFVA